MNELMPFEFQGNQVRVVMRDGEPWWVARDVCEVLELGNVSQAVSRLEEDEKATVPSNIISNEVGGRDPWVVNEPGLYDLVLACRKPEARAFKRWITHEVLPSIRKTGAYVAPQQSPTQGQLLVAMAQAYEAQERRLLELAAAQATTQIQVTDIAARVEGMRARQQEAAEELTALPAPAGDVPGLTTRAQLNRLVRSYCLENGFGHSEAWGRLYLEFRDRHHVDLKARASGKKGPLDVAETEGLMEKLYALGYLLFGRKGAN